MVIAAPVITGLFQRGAFDASAASATAAALTAYSVGLPAYVLIKVLTPGYFARKDTKTPVRIAVLSMVVNLVLNLILMGPLQHVGLALATAIAAWLNAILLAWGLRRRGFLKIDPRLRRRVPRIAFAALVLAVALWAGRLGLERLAAGYDGERFGTLAILVVGGGIVYALVAQITGAARLGELRSLLRPRASG